VTCVSARQPDPEEELGVVRRIGGDRSGALPVGDRAVVRAVGRAVGRRAGAIRAWVATASASAPSGDASNAPT
jgi:hypothetical protein